jgi:hypothetical protein
LEREIESEIEEQLMDESHSPLHLHRCDIPSTKFEEVSEESSPPILELSVEAEGFPRIEYFYNDAGR